MDWMIPFLKSFSKASTNQQGIETKDRVSKTRDENDRRIDIDTASLDIKSAEALFEIQSKDHRDNNASLSPEMVAEDIRQLYEYIKEAINVLGLNPDSRIRY